MKRFVIMFIISTLIASMLLQCEKDERIHWTTYTTSDGLVSNHVTAIAIDKEGNKWFAAYDYYSDPNFFPNEDNSFGVSKFDGTNWTNYSKSDGLISNYVNAIAIDNEGNKWFGAYGGVSKFDGTNWTNYTRSDGLVSNYVNTIAIDNAGNRWIGAYDLKNPYEFGDPIGGASKFDGTSWAAYTTSDGLLGNGVSDIAIDAKGNIWFVSWSLCYDYIVISKKVGSPVADDYEQCFGVSRFDGTNWTNYNTSDGLISDCIYAIAIDNEGNKWFGTDNGVSKFDGTNWTNYTTSNGLISDYIYAIAIDNEGNKWFGTDKGVSKFDGTNWTNYTTSDGLISDCIFAIAIDNEGNKWFGTDRGVSKLSDKY